MTTPVAVRGPVRAGRPAVVRRRRAALLFKSLYHYRRPLCERLRDDLAAAGVDLDVIYGQPGREDAPKRDAVELPWGRRIRNVVIPVGRRELFWQPALPHLREVDLVIVEMASKLLVNYVLAAQQELGWRRLAYLGHGFNARQRPGTRLGEAVKHLLARRAHWWFAYNTLGVEAVGALGVPRDRITDIQNAIDTRALAAQRAAVTAADLARRRGELGLTGDHVGVFVGGMYADKLLGLLLDACDRIRDAVPDFEMLFIGAGPDEGRVARAAAQRPWLHWLGPRFEADKVAYLMLAQVLLLPGAVGLGVLDAFALRLPLVTIAERYHGPEIAYVAHGTNGIVVPPTDQPDQYAKAVITLLHDPLLLDRLRDGCARAAEHYTIEAMSARFADGIVRALDR